MEKLTAEAVADAMYAMVKECHGKRQLKPLDLSKAMLERFGEGCDKNLCKEAIRLLVEDERCTYSYLGGSYIVLPPDSPARPEPAQSRGERPSSARPEPSREGMETLPGFPSQK